MHAELVQMLHLRPAAAWTIPVLLTQAAAGVGVDAVVEALAAHRTVTAADAERAGREAARRESELLDILDEEVRRRLARGLGTGTDGVQTLVASVRDGRLDPYTAALRILDDASTLERLLERR
jgi:LAO/AO transport system kinase